MSTMRSGAPTRRHALKLAGGAALAATATAALPAAASARGPGRYPATPLLSVPARHLVNRFSYGITPELADEVRAAGGHLAWFDQQLETAYDGSADNLCDWWPDLHLDPATLWQRQVTGVKDGIAMMQEYGRRILLRRMTSPRQVLEVMTELWETLLHVPAGADGVFVYRTEYGELVRAHALGRFEDLLVGAVLHPAMLTYLGASTSTKAHPNENLGRELLELHTVGLGSYTEDDVKNSARILTGFGIAADRSGAAYDPRAHWTGPVRVMGFSDANAAPDGSDVARRYLSYLAHHPSTARRIATRLARAFVSDAPPPGLVERLATAYLANDTAIAPVLRVLVSDPEFGTAVDAKVRDAERDVVATYRLLGVQLPRPRSVMSAANQVNDQAAGLGLAPFQWPRPDGKPIANAAWTSPTRILGSMSLHWTMAGRLWPMQDIRFRSYADWLPRSGSLEFRDVVDHLSRLLLHRPSTDVLLEACCIATGLDRGARVEPGRGLTGWAWPRLLAAVLDSPDFYTY